MKTLSIRQLSPENLEDILVLAQQLNPSIAPEELKARQLEMFKIGHYRCFGLLHEGKIIGLSSGWITVRFYSGKQLELDNVIVNNQIQSRGYGKIFLDMLEQWAKEEGCQTVELNAYVQNARSHKFYFNNGYKILGFHFQKLIN